MPYLGYIKNTVSMKSKLLIMKLFKMSITSIDMIIII